MRADCIEHTQVGNGGYGCTARVIDGKRRRLKLHRIAYCEANGLHIDDIADVVIRHKCDNPRCINPEHLEPGTQADNMHDMNQRGRRVGNKVLTPEQVDEVRRLYKPYDKEFGGAALARRFDVDQKTISCVVNNKTWSNHDCN